ncbi:MAG TPA: PHP domain-containing protein [Gaiellaceae bacterium]|nr:PHP domain-containing protein [Gaiellaceae bacterium]
MSRDPTNAEIADRLSAFATLLELADTSPFAVRAYARAAELVRSSPASVAELVRTGRARDLRGVGPSIEAKLRELVETGEIAELDELERDVRPELVAYARLIGVSTGRMLAIAKALDLATVAEFREAVRGGRLLEVRGIGPATEEAIRDAVARGGSDRRGLTIARSREVAGQIAAELGGEIAGAARRFCELSYELVVVCAFPDASEMVERFARLPLIVTVLERRDHGATGLTVDGVLAELFVAPPASFGTALVRATGSPAYVESLGSLPDAASEEELFARLGLDFVPPELREDAGSTAPVGLVGRGDIRGDLHCHTTASDGRSTVHEMALAAIERGYEYLAICDHTPSVGVVPGLDTEALRRQAEEIARVNELVAPFRVLRGVECDIRPDGTLDAEDAVLAELDWVQLSLHAGQRRSSSELTRIVSEAMRHPAVRALSHPKGRILNRRPENALDLDEIFEVAKEAEVALEVNGLPDRLDLSATHVAEALAAGVELVLNSDAHSAQGLERLDLALATARKGSATTTSIVNCRPLADVVSQRG